MCGKGHKYQKFNENYLFCSRCGELKFVASPSPRYYYTWPTPWQPYTPFWTSSTTPFTTWNTDNATYTFNTVADLAGATTDGEEDEADPGVGPQ